MRARSGAKRSKRNTLNWACKVNISEAVKLVAIAAVQIERRKLEALARQ